MSSSSPLKKSLRTLKKLSRSNGLTASAFLTALLNEFTTLSLAKQNEIISDYYLSLSARNSNDVFLRHLPTKEKTCQLMTS